eukprot:CAMPEP_0119123622 /NCGR_PEP_ID=MMETSP1310-20130426/3507_1 /TAXON_ID=464262 /ORGANISM="Genus nov. species nov., Strain RCC2339" /LENGTH=230 /DNA_ID=CAMNT_0007113467 /DNA_START=180 /DNA_END=869 /DNA_ORIENTATION=+
MSKLCHGQRTVPQVFFNHSYLVGGIAHIKALEKNGVLDELLRITEEQPFEPDFLLQIVLRYPTCVSGLVKKSASVGEREVRGNVDQSDGETLGVKDSRRLLVSSVSSAEKNVRLSFFGLAQPKANCPSQRAVYQIISIMHEIRYSSNTDLPKIRTSGRTPRQRFSRTRGRYFKAVDLVVWLTKYFDGEKAAVADFVKRILEVGVLVERDMTSNSRSSALTKFRSEKEREK